MEIHIKIRQQLRHMTRKRDGEHKTQQPIQTRSIKHVVNITNIVTHFVRSKERWDYIGILFT